MHRLALTLLLMTAPAAAQPSLASLPRVLRTANDVDGARRALAAEGWAVERTRSGLRLRLAPTDARRVARVLGLQRPCGVSGDVHQRRFWMLECRPFEGDRLAADEPRAGGWVLRVRLAERPRGPLPREVAGASPAYDLRARRASVVSIELERADQPRSVRRPGDHSR